MQKNSHNKRQKQADFLIDRVHDYFNRCDQSLPSRDVIFNDEVPLGSADRSVLIGQFTEAPTIKSGTARAIGETIEFVLSDLPALGVDHPLAQLDPHPENKRNYLWQAQGYVASHDMKALKAYSQFNNITTAVMGHVEGTDSAPVLHLRWCDVSNNRIINQIALKTQSAEDKYSTLILKALVCILKQLKVALDDKDRYLLNEYLIEKEVIFYMDLMHELGDGPWSELSQASSRPALAHVNLPSLAFLLLELEKEGNDPFNRVTKRYEWLEAQWNSHSWLLVLQAKKYESSDDEDIDNESAKVLLRAFRKNPGNVKLLHTTIDMMLCAEHYPEALSLALDILKKDPHHFENWWGLSAALSDTAWYFRGHDWWDKVGQDNQDIFIDLCEMSEKALNVAMQIQPHCPYLIEDKIKSLQGPCEELRSLLRLSIKVDPAFEGSYDAALNFTQPRWGGCLEEQMTIVKLAYEKNTKQKWPLELYKHHVESNSDYKISTRIKLMFKRFIDKNWPDCVFETSDD